MAFRYIKDIWAAFRQNANNDVWLVTDSGLPISTTGAGMLGPGSTYIDIATGIPYTNIGTKAVPIWVNVATPVVVTGGLAGIGNAKMTYDFTVDGGAATTTIVPANSPTLPINAIILGGTVDVTVACVGAGSISLGTTAGSGVASLKAATAAATYAINTQQPIIPVFTAATYLKLTAAGRLSLTTSVGTITAGRFDVNVAYVIGN